MKQGCSTKLGRIITSAMLLVATVGSVISSSAQDVQEGAPTCTPPPANLVAWWPGEGNANDIAGGNNATFSSSGVTYASGKVGQGFRFDGTNGYLQIPDSAALKPTNVTAEAWVWLDPNLPANRGGEQIVFKKNTWSAWFEGYSLLKVTIDNGNGTYSDRFQFCISRNGNQVALNSQTIAQRGVWYHVAGTYDGNKSTLWVNGVAEASATPGFALDYDTTPIYIGTSGTWAPYLSMFGGIIDEPSIYNRALTTNEIVAIYQAGSAGKCVPPSLAPVVIAGPVTNYANGHIYYLLDGSTWTQAETKAVTLGGHLATINNADENSWVVATFSSYGGTNRSLWIGFNDTQQEGNFVWSSGEAATFTNWRAGEPNGGNGPGDDYTYIYGVIPGYSLLGQWNDTSDLITPGGAEPPLYGVVEIAPATPTCTAPPSGLVGWWPAEGNAADNVNGNNGSLQGAITFAGGKVASAFAFNNTNADVVIPASASLNVGASNGFTLEAWINPTDVTQVHPLFEWNTSGWGVHFHIAPGQPTTGSAGPAGPGQLYANIVDTFGSWHQLGSSAGVVVSNVFQHVALTYDKTSGIARIYCNGQIVSQTTLGSFTPLTTFNLNLGRRPAPSAEVCGFLGLMDEPSVYNRALSTNEIAAIYAAGSAGKCFTPAPPFITQQPTNQTITVGLPVTFSIAASGSAPISYQWQFNGNPIAGATNSIYAIAAAQTNQAGAYRAVVTNPFGATNSAPATLTVLPLPMVPVITDFTPKSGTNGAIVTLTGTNFSPVAASNIVYFGAVRATVISASATSLMVSVPIGATHAPITVAVNGLVAYSGKLFDPTFLGNGSGITSSSFAPRLNLAAGNNPYRVIVGDIDGDGKPDLIVGNIFGTSISLYRNISTGGLLTTASFAPRVDIQTPAGSYSPYGLAVGDVDGDGKLDIIASDYSANLVSIYRNISSPGTISSNSFATRVDLTTGTQPQGVEVRDIDGDGRPDLLVANGGNATLSIYRNTGVAGNITTNSFAPRVNITTGAGCTYMVIGDLNDDGRLDVVTANSGSSTLSVFRNLSASGSITLSPKVDFAVPSGPNQMAIGDLDGDGKLDLTVASYLPQTFSVYRNINNGGLLTSNSFAPRIDYSLGGRGHTPTIADLDGDGKPDIAVVTELNSVLSVFRNVSTPGSFTNSSLSARVDFATGNNPWSVTAGDLNGDGRPDLILCNQYDSTLSIYQNQVPFAGPPVITLQPTNQTIVLGDNTSFNVAATGPQPFTYQWNFNGGAIAGATNSLLILTDAQLSQAGNYSVSVANPLGSVLSSNATLTVTVPVCTPPPANLVAWWSAENNAFDSMGTNSGSPTGGISYTNGKAGQAFLFNQSSSYIPAPASPSLNIGTGSGITIEAWVKPQPNVNAPIIEWDSASTDGLQLWVANFNSALFANVKDTAGNAHTLSFPYTFDTNNFQHIAMTYDKSSGLARLFVNGAIVTSANFGNITPQTTYPVNIGRRTGQPIGLNDTYGGLIDELSLYNRALSTNEIAAIYAARGAGKCPLSPTVLNVTPPSWYVNEGSTVSYAVTAVGSPVLTYQWQHNGSDIAGATNATLILSNVVYAQAGNYAVVVSNPAGMITSTNVLLLVNRAPVADASATDTLAISPNGTNAIVVLDGSLSSDPDGNPLTYAWFNFGDTNVLATSVVAITPLPVGTNQITLTVNDGMAFNSQTIAIEVITTSQALDRLIALVQSGSGNTQPLIASLRAALAAIDRSQPAVAINQLEAFINKVHVQLEPSDPVLAAQLIADAQAIIDALNGGTSVAVASVEITSLTPDHHGKAHLKIKGIKGRVHVIETSTNMVDWTPVGVAKQSADDSFEFDDSGAQDTGARFYRVVSPK